MMAGLALALVACSNDIEETDPSPSAVSTPSTNAVGTHASTTNAETVADGSAAPLPPDATTEAIATAASNVLGPTDNAVAELAPFVDPPADIPTPADATVVDFGVKLGTDVVADVHIATAASPADVSMLFQTEMRDAGYRLVSARPVDFGSFEERRLEFTATEASVVYDSVMVDIVDLLTLTDLSAVDHYQPGRPTRVYLRLRGDFQSEWADRANVWPGALPGVEVDLPNHLTVSTSMYRGRHGDRGLHLRARYSVPGHHIADLRKAIGAALPIDTYRASSPTDRPVAEAPHRTAIPVERDGMKSVTFEIMEDWGSGEGVVIVSGDIPLHGDDRGGESRGGEHRGSTSPVPSAETTGEPTGTAVTEGRTSFTSPSSEYSVEFPGGVEPEREESEVMLAGYGEVPMTFFVVESGDRAYGVGRVEFPVPLADPDVALKGARDRVVSGVNGTLFNTERLRLQGRPGIQFAVDVDSDRGEGAAVMLNYLEDRQILYHLIVIGPSDLDESDADVRAFFESFEFEDG